ncbi:MAG: 30S ribosome-binding factor RbfA [Asticcacaulis sp.]
MKRNDHKSGRGQKTEALGPTQRQLRAGELVRHALVEILREEEIHDDDLNGVSVTVTEVRCSPDLRHATVFVEPLGAGLIASENKEAAVKPAIEALNRHAKYLRGILGRRIDMKFTPDLRFLHDESFNEASRIDALLARPDVVRDLLTPDDESEDGDNA